MKKLMVMLSAAAMAFGLYADATFATSFEADDAGVSGTTFTPGEAWSGLAETVTLSTYAGDAYTYGTGAFARRDDMFVGKADQANYLSLETGKDTVTHAAGDVYLDQLVKFTGFEEEATVAAGTKIAVWLSAIDEDGYVPAVTDEEGNEITPASGTQGATNLYVTAWQNKAGVAQKVNFAIPAPAGQEWKTDKWYRLTIKNIGDIYGGAAISDDARAGFIIYVDGVQVGCEEAKDCIEYASEMTTAAKGYMNRGQLFAAIDTTDVAFATVGYQGIGAIDDIIVDNAGPDFCKAVEVTIDPVTGAIIKKVIDENGEVEAKAPGVYDIAPGAFQIVWGNAEGYMPFEKMINHNTNDESFNDSKALEEDIKPVVVEVNYDETNTVAYADAPSALAAVAAYTDIPGNAVAVDFKQGVTNEFYAFDTGTKIAISDDYVAPEEEAAVEEEETEVAPIHSHWDITAGNVTFLTGLENNKIVTIDDDHTLTFAGTMKAGSSITAKNIVTQEGAIALDPVECSVLTLNDNLDAAFVVPTGYTLGKYTFEDDPDDPLYGWTQYYLEEVVIVPVCKIGNEEYGSLADAFEAAENGDEIELLADIETERVDIDASRNITLNMAGKKITLATENTAREQVIVWGGLNDALQTGTLTITGNGTIDTGYAEAGIAVWACFGNIVIENGTYTVFGQGECVFARNYSNVRINGGTFTNYKTGDQCGDVLNAENHETVKTIQCYGGSYSKDPEEGDDALGPTFVAPGYKSVKNGNLWDVVAKVEVTLTISAENATVTGIEAGTVLEGSNLTFTVAANTGYKLVDVKANGAVLTADDQGNYTYAVTGEETDKALAIVVAVEKDAPAGPTSEEADIGKPHPSTGIYPVTPKPGATEVVVENGLGQRFSFPSSVKTIKGVNADQVFIQGNGGHDITELLTKTGDATTGVTYDLNPEAKDGDVPVKPTIEAVDTEFDITGGKMEVKGIQGLYYSLVGSEDVKTVSTGAVCDTATVEKTGDTVSLTDEGTKGAAKFYVIKVSIDAPAVE